MARDVTPAPVSWTPGVELEDRGVFGETLLDAPGLGFGGQYLLQQSPPSW